MQTRVTTADTVAGTAVPEGAPALPPRISWGAVFAGGIVALAIGIMLDVLGVAVGASVVDATRAETPAGSSFGIAGAIWVLVATLIGLGVGGYVAARLSGTSDDTDSVLHGLSVWGIAYLFSAVVLGNVVAGTAGTAFQGTASILGGLTQGAGQAVQAAAGPVAQRVDPRQLVERAQSALRTGGDPAAMTSDQRKAEITTLVTRRVADGNLSAADRDRLNALVAAEYGLSPQEAQQRVQQVEDQATQTVQQAERQAREAADAAATAAAVTAYWAFATMLLGAAAAVLGARVGARTMVAVRRLA